MGILADFEITNFVIKKKNLDKALRRLRKLGQGWWVDEEVNLQKATLKEILSAWSWEAEFDASGNLVALKFTGDKAGSEDELFEALAPFIEPGAIIIMSHDFGMDYIKIAEDGIRRGSAMLTEYKVQEIFIDTRKLSDAANALRKIKPDYWFDENVDTGEASFDELIRAWRWVPGYDQIGNLIGLEYVCEGSGDESEVLKKLGPFIRKGAVVEQIDDCNDWQWTFSGKRAKREMIRYKGP